MAWELEDAVVKATPSPRTRASLASDLRALGVGQGAPILVHSSLRSLGWVAGNAVAVVQALMDVVTPEGTLMMPTFTAGNSDPAGWMAPPVPAEWVPEIRASMPGFDPRYSPSSGVGAVPEVFRSFPGVVRSGHPFVSFAAWGRDAASLVEKHSLENCLGEESPLGELYRRDGRVLFLGTGYATCTSFHLAEYRAAGSPRRMRGAAVVVEGRQEWREYADIELEEGFFADIGAAMEGESPVRMGRVGSAQCRFFAVRPAVDFAVRWLNEQRSQAQ